MSGVRGIEAREGACLSDRPRGSADREQTERQRFPPIFFFSFLLRLLLNVLGRAGGRFRPPSAPPPLVISTGGGTHTCPTPPGRVYYAYYSPGKQLTALLSLEALKMYCVMRASVPSDAMIGIY